ncbi:MAG: ABC transporter permease [Lachnospiraceae bacterium]|jgi:ABC-type dipeptide/oligopeptide/nickel transport system permease component|nr:ABC transporter permease [Lachnospiraceae bacterium]MCI1726944.1 ABC transporter permease [Lachnospiraceae bacterium]
MARYVVKRILWLLVIMVCVAILIFTILYFVPGDPAKQMLGDSATQEEIDALRQKMGLDQPYIVQLGTYLYNTFIKWDFGTSYSLKVPVIQEFMTRLPRTFLLGTLCVLIDGLVGIPLGIAAAMHRNSAMDHGLMIATMIGISIPGFWLALLMIMLFSQQLHWLPAYGIDSWQCWIMPVIAGSLAGLAQNARQTRSAVLETIRADFVTTARAKGLPERKVIYGHMLPNALIPIVNGLGGLFAGAIGGTVVIETVFTFPGVGLLLLNGITARDYPVVRSCVLILAIFSAAVMLIVDLIYAYIDPRIKAQYVRLGKGNGRKGAHRHE